MPLIIWFQTRYSARFVFPAHLGSDLSATGADKTAIRDANGPAETFLSFMRWKQPAIHLKGDRELPPKVSYCFRCAQHFKFLTAVNRSVVMEFNRGTSRATEWFLGGI